MTRLPAWLSLGSLVLLLAILAWYQYRWIGEVNRTERAQMRSALQTILDTFARDFDRELTRLALLFADVQTGQTDAELERELTIKHQRWETAAQDPKFLGAIWVVRIGEAGGAALSRFDPKSAKMISADWPPELVSVERRIASLSLADGEPLARRGRVHLSFTRRWPIPLAPEIPAVILPTDTLRGTLERMEASGPRRPILQSFLILQLDAAHLREVFFPALARRYNLSGETSSYEIAVVDQAGDHLYATGAGRSAEPHPADGRTRLFAFLPPQEAQDLWRELGGAGPLPPPPLLRGDGANLAFEHDEDAVGDPRPARIVVFAGARGVEQAPWRILAFHRQGSLDAAVAQARTRNLLVVAVILLLLAASVGLLIASNRRARRLALQQMDFVAAMTHELRTPLATIRSLAENLAHGIVPGEDQARAYGAMIVRQEQRLARLVEGVLDFSGMGLAPSLRSLADVDARTIVADAIEETRPMFAAAGASLDSDLPAHGCRVRADPEALSRALQNLLSNAVKFGGPHPAVSLHLECPDDDHEVRIAVSDRGPGIADDDLPRVFEPFFRSAAARAAKLPGNGLGLSLVQRIVTAHHGRVDVQSRPGQGTTFTVRLPQAPEVAVPGMQDAR